MFRTHEVTRALLVIERSHLADMLTDVINPTKVGRPPILPMLAYCVARLLLAGDGAAQSHANTAKLLNTRLTAQARRKLGLEESVQVTRRHVENIDNSIARHLAATVTAAPTLGDGMTDGEEMAERVRRTLRLTLIVDSLLDASKPLDLAATGHYALDASGIHAWHRRPRYKTKDAPELLADTDPSVAVVVGGLEITLEGPLPILEIDDDSIDDEAAHRSHRDPDAAFGHKTAKAGEDEKFYGYDLYALIRVLPVGATGAFPHLFERFALAPAGSNEPISSLPVIRAMLDSPSAAATGNYPIDELLVDRGFTYKTAENWAFPLRELGISQILDLHKNDHGVRDYQGVRMIAGRPHCPGMADEHTDIRRPARLRISKAALNADTGPELGVPDTPELLSKSEQETLVFRQRIAARAPYLLRYNGEIASGDRFQCPARAGTVRCPLVEKSLEFDLSVPTVARPPAADTAPKCCTQSTITVPWNVTPKIRQKLVWGSDGWIRSFARRTHIEGGFGNVKNPNTENLSRGWLQVSGLVRHTLGMAFVLAAYNLRIAQKWNDETGLSTDPVFAPTPTFTLLHEPEELPTADEPEATDEPDAQPLAA